MSRIGTYLKRLATSEASRAFVTGAGIDTFGAQMMWGEPQRYEQNEISSYISTSNSVYTCANYRAKLLSSLPLAYYKNQKGGKKIDAPAPTISELLSRVNPYWCVDEKTEALTARGWVSGDELSESDAILSMRPTDGRLVWSRVRSIFRGTFDGEMIPIRSSQIDALVTPGHKFPTMTGELVEVERLRQGDRLRTMGESAETEGPSLYSDAFVELVGWFVTEGHIVKTRHRKGGRGENPVYGDFRDVATTVQISQKDGTARCERIRDALKCHGERWHETTAGTERSIRMFCVTGDTAAALQEAAPDKVMTPKFITGISPDQRTLLIETMVDADGSRHPASSTRYFMQRRKEIVDSFTMLCALNGQATTAKFRTWKEGQDHRGDPLWVVSVRTYKTKCIRRTISEREQYNGPIWCPETDYGTFVCRRNGVVSVTGNTFGRLMEMTELSLCLWGECFWLFEKTGVASGQPKELWWAPSDEMKVIPGKDATNYVDHFEYRPNNRYDPIIYQPKEVIWLHYPNPLNQFAGLSPIMAAAIAADTGRAAQVSNMMMFRNGLNPGGFIMPDDPKATMTKEQAQGVEEAIGQRFKGADKAHRWAVLRGGLKFQPNTMSPKDAEFLGVLDWSFEEICRAYGVPIDLIGGKSTYNNVNDARRAIWTETMVPEARFIANELTEQLLPLFPGEADLIEFDTSNISVLQDDQDALWARTMTAFLGGAIRLNEVREIFKLDPIKGVMGDALILPRGSAYIDDTGEVIATAAGVGDLSALTGLPFDTTQPTDANPAPGATVTVQPPAEPKALPAGKVAAKDAKGQPADKTAPRALGGLRTRAMPYGSTEHVRALDKAHDRLKPHEDAFGRMCADLMRRQRQSVLSKLKGDRAAKSRDALKEIADNPFDKAAWTKQFRVASRPVLQNIVADAGQQLRDDLNISAAFDVKDPNVIKFLEQRAQRFATQVNETTWTDLQDTLFFGIDEGESIDDLAARVKSVMGERIASSAEVIARTEVLGASSGGSLLSAKESGVVGGKEWIAALDNRTRPDHADAHGQTVALDDDFQVGEDTGPGPGMMGSPENDCNCRCVASYIIDTDWNPDGEEG